MTAQLVTLPPLMTAHGTFAPDVLLTVQQAAALCACHEMTVRRRLRLGRIPGAVRRGVPGAQRWFLPLGGLAAAGLIPAEQVAAPGTPPDPGRAGGQGHLQHLADENQRLRATVTGLQRDVAFLQALLPTMAGGGAA